MQLKVLSWNIWCGTYLEEVIAFLKKEQPDIIALQEVLEQENGNIALTIAKELGYEGVYALGMHMPAKFLNNPDIDPEKLVSFGNAILSKHKITSTATHDLPQGDNPRPAIQADIRIGDETFHVFSLHLKHSHQQPLEMQNIQADTLLTVVPGEKSIVMGDFNCLPDSYPIQTISNVLSNTEPGEQTPTWCQYIGGCSVCQIDEIKYKLDYIFVTKDVISKDFSVLQSKGSDHLPVSATIEV